MAKQIGFFEYHNLKSVKIRYGRTVHGGCNPKGHRKLERPLSTAKPMHLVLKSEKATGKLSFWAQANKDFVEITIRNKAQKFGVAIYDYVNVGNHLHIKLKITTRELFQKFLKSVTALIARHVTGARRGKKFGKFWQGLAFTRVLTTTREELYLKGYFEANRQEVAATKLGLQREYRESFRKDFLAQFQSWVYRERLKTKYLRYREVETATKF